MSRTSIRARYNGALTLMRVNANVGRIELLRRKKEGPERLYADIFQKLPAALQELSYPISMMGAISVHASPEGHKLYYDHMDSTDHEETRLKHCF